MLDCASRSARVSAMVVRGLSEKSAMRDSIAASAGVMLGSRLRREL